MGGLNGIGDGLYMSQVRDWRSKRWDKGKRVSLWIGIMLLWGKRYVILVFVHGFVHP